MSGQDAAAPVLETRALTKNFGALRVARDIDFQLEAGARHALIGPNGAGKTTFINLITGRLKPSSGQVLVAGQDISHLSEHERVKRGIARTFQINTLFPELTATDNLYLPIAERLGVAGRQLRPAAAHPAVLAEVELLLAAFGLEADARKPVRTLPYGRQRLLEIAIAIALKPTVLLLDEPTSGVPAGDSHIVMDMVQSLSREIAVLIIEHDMEMVFRFAERITVMVNGAILRHGSAAEIAADAEVRAVYLGEDGDGRTV